MTESNPRTATLAPKQAKKMGRLAMRQEGEWWGAYYALPGTMENALPLGSLHMKFAASQKHKAAFMALMQECVGDIVEEEFGTRPVWGGPEAAPESERGGRG